MATALGGGGPWPPFFLGDGAGMEVVLHPKAAAWEKNFVVLAGSPEIRDFLSLYELG